MAEYYFELAEKYSGALFWIANFYPQGSISSQKDIIYNAKEHTMKIIGCSSEKFDELKKFGLDDFMVEKNDLQILVCYWEYIDKIRKAHL